MGDKIQVVRVEINETVKNEHGDFYLATVQSNHFASVQIPIPVGDVIELTKKSRAIFGDGRGDRYRTRLVSEWAPADE